MPSLRCFLDLFLDDGLQLGVTRMWMWLRVSTNDIILMTSRCFSTTVYLLYLDLTNHPDLGIATATMVSVTGSCTSALLALYRIVSGWHLIGKRRHTQDKSADKSIVASSSIV